MRLLSQEQDFVNTLNNIRNSGEGLIMDVFNAGYEACLKEYSELFKQADAAIEQNLINEVPVGQNPFIVLLQKANKMKETAE